MFVVFYQRSAAVGNLIRSTVRFEEAEDVADLAGRCHASTSPLLKGGEVSMKLGDVRECGGHGRSSFVSLDAVVHYSGVYRPLRGNDLQGIIG